MIRIDRETGRPLIVIECDECRAVLPWYFPTRFNLATVRQRQILRRIAKKKGWYYFNAGDRDVCPSCFKRSPM